MRRHPSRRRGTPGTATGDATARRLPGRPRRVGRRSSLRDVVGWATASYVKDAPRRGRLAQPAGHRPQHRERSDGADASRPSPGSSTRPTACTTCSDDGWATSPIDRMEVLLRADGVPIGIVTDGRWWASGLRPPKTHDRLRRRRRPDLDRGARHPGRLRSPCSRRSRSSGARTTDRLPALFDESVAAAEEITEALGAQVRRAVELLVQSFSESAEEARRRGEPDPLPDDGDVIYAGRGHGHDAGGVPAVRRGTRPAPAGRAVRPGLRHRRATRPARARAPRTSDRSPGRHLTDAGTGCSPPPRRSTAAPPSRTCACPPTAAPCSTRPASRS